MGGFCTFCVGSVICVVVIVRWGFVFKVFDGVWRNNFFRFVFMGRRFFGIVFC